MVTKHLGRRQFAYFVMTGGKKRVGGTMTADSMEDAAERVIRREKIEVISEPSVIRPCDGAVIRPARMKYKGEWANVAVWVRAEDFAEAV